MTITKKLEIDSTTIIDPKTLISSIDNFYKTLIEHGVALILLDINIKDRNNSLNGTKFYNTTNDVLNSENLIKEPTLDEKLNPKKIKNKAPDSNQGWIHQYCTPIHILVQQNSIYRSIIKNLYNIDSDIIKHKPNRIRYCINNKRSTNSIHFDVGGRMLGK